MHLHVQVVCTNSTKKLADFTSAEYCFKHYGYCFLLNVKDIILKKILTQVLCTIVYFHFLKKCIEIKCTSNPHSFDSPKAEGTCIKISRVKTKILGNGINRSFKYPALAYSWF